MKITISETPKFDAIISYLSSPFVSNRTSDVTIQCRDGFVKSHKIILASVSEVLADMLKENVGDKESWIILPDFSVQSLGLFLDNIYNFRDISEFQEINQLLMKNDEVKNTNAAGDSVKKEKFFSRELFEDFGKTIDEEELIIHQAEEDNDEHDIANCEIQEENNEKENSAKEKNKQISVNKKSQPLVDFLNRYIRDHCTMDDEGCLICNYCGLNAGNKNNFSNIEDYSFIRQHLQEEHKDHVWTWSGSGLNKSFLWKYYILDPFDKFKAICNFCGRKCSRNYGSTAGMRSHLYSAHNDLLEEYAK